MLLLDEPYAGFDFDTYERFWDLTAERRSAGRSVVVIIHFITDQARFDRIVELRDGLTCASMSSMSGLVARRALLEYARKPLKLVMLVLVPVVLVFVWGPTLADFSKLSGGSGDAASAQS